MSKSLCLSKKEVVELKSILKSNLSNEKIVIFGSRVNGRAHENSDLDLAIIGEDKLPYVLISNLKESFENASFSFRVDLLDYYRISKEIQIIIDSTGMYFEYKL